MSLFSSHRTALVTGASRGIGLKIAEEFEKFNVSVLRPSRAEMNLSSCESIKNYIKKLKEKNQRIDILVNNAGINELSPLLKITESAYDEMFSTNVRSALLLSQNLIENMVQQKWGRIVNIASIFGEITREKRAMYSMTKSAISSLTRSLTTEFAGFGVLSNTVSPGYVETDLTYKNNSPQDIEKLLLRVPIRRLAHPEEIAKIVVFLCSDYNTYLTGQNIFVDGGLLIN